MLSGHVRGPGLRRRKERSAPGTAPRPELTTGGKGTVSVGEASWDRRCLPGGGGPGPTRQGGEAAGLQVHLGVRAS